jgi:hypothetical protein
VFDEPIRIDRANTIERPTPNTWKSKIESTTVPVVPLVNDADAQ